MDAANEPTAGAPGTLHQQVGRGLRWSVVHQIVGRLTSVLSGIVVARILVPEDYGVFAVALLVVNILFGLNDLGMLLAVVRWTGDLRRATSTAMTIAFGFSWVLYAACWVAAPPFAAAMGSPESTGVLRLLAFTIVIDGFTTVPHGLIVREFRTDRLAKSEFIALPFGLIVTLVLALGGAGAWSLAWGQIVANTISAAALFRFARHIPRFGFDPAAARRMLSYGVPLALTSLVEYVLLNADYTVVGRTLGPLALGFYVLAYNVSNWPLSMITDAIRRVSIVGFSRLTENEESLRANFHRAFSLLLAVAIPICLLLSMLAGPLVEVLYGRKWAAAAEILRFLALFSIIRMAVGFIFDLLVGVGRTRQTLFLQALWVAVVIPALFVGAHLGAARGVAITHVIVGCAVALPLFLEGTRRLGVPITPIISQVVRPLVGAAAMATAGWLVLRVPAAPFVHLMVGGLVMSVVYILVVVPMHVLRSRAFLPSRFRPAAVTA